MSRASNKDQKNTRYCDAHLALYGSGPTEGFKKKLEPKLTKEFEEISKDLPSMSGYQLPVFKFSGTTRNRYHNKTAQQEAPLNHTKYGLKTEDILNYDASIRNDIERQNPAQLARDMRPALNNIAGRTLELLRRKNPELKNLSPQQQKILNNLVAQRVMSNLSQQMIIANLRNQTQNQMNQKPSGTGYNIYDSNDPNNPCNPNNIATQLMLGVDFNYLDESFNLSLTGGFSGIANQQRMANQALRGEEAEEEKKEDQIEENLLEQENKAKIEEKEELEKIQADKNENIQEETSSKNQTPEPKPTSFSDDEVKKLFTKHLDYKTHLIKEAGKLSAADEASNTVDPGESAQYSPSPVQSS